jgi:hypothetical protein
MKAERRHELQENVLAGWLARQIELIKPYWPTILAVLVVVSAAMLAYNVVRARSSAKKSQGWPEYFQATAENNIGELEKVAEDFPKTASGASALQAAADLRFVTGTNQLYSNPKGARLDLNEAVDDYSTVLERAEKLKHETLTRRALFGLARANESLFEISKAKERYQELVDDFPETPQAKVAKRRLETLARPATKEFLAWLSKQEFKPLPMNLPGTQPGSPGMGDTLPGIGDRSDPASFGAASGGRTEDDTSSTDISLTPGEGAFPIEGTGTDAEPDADRSSSFPLTPPEQPGDSATDTGSESPPADTPEADPTPPPSSDSAETTEPAPNPTASGEAEAEESEESSDAP